VYAVSIYLNSVTARREDCKNAWSGKSFSALIFNVNADTLALFARHCLCAFRGAKRGGRAMVSASVRTSARLSAPKPVSFAVMAERVRFRDHRMFGSRVSLVRS